MQTQAEVVKLDKSYPLIRTKHGTEIRAEYCANLSKKHVAVAIGDYVKISTGDGPENYNSHGSIPSNESNPAIIEEILPRKTTLVRNDPVNRKREQVLAANFDSIAICTAAGSENFNHTARMLVIAANSCVPITLIFTKCDLCEPDCCTIEPLLPLADDIICTAFKDAESKSLEIKVVNCDAVCNPLVPNSFKGDGPLQNTTTVLLGKSGVGKSTLINALAGRNVCKQGNVREFDSKGRHTTVSREIICTEKHGRIVDMPGVRSLGLINCEKGLKTVFSDIYGRSENCKFRNCKHSGEPGCAVASSVNANLLAAYHELTLENEVNSAKFHR